ncbi:hypothetical protein [Sporosarcina psychrophila]|uniref:Uncharacterized protein n=1 Tax=Sporosarcina psychrophila TaxID=1476 RepID=A0ABV2KEW2_SPOPS
MSEEKTDSKINKESVVKWGVIIAAIVISIPLLIALLLNVNIFNFALGNTESWIAFWGSYIGGMFGMIGVIITTYIIISNNKKNIEYSMELQDRQVRDRDATTFLLNKSEQVVELLDDANTLLSTSMSLFIRMAVGREFIEMLASQMDSGRSTKVDIESKISIQTAELNEMSEKSLSLRPLVIDRLNKAVAKSVFIDGVSDEIRDLIEFIIKQEDIITDAMVDRESSELINQMSKELIDEVSIKYNPIQRRLTEFSREQLEKLMNG